MSLCVGDRPVCRSGRNFLPLRKLSGSNLSQGIGHLDSDFSWFSSVHQINVGRVIRLRPDCFFPNHSQLFFHKSSDHSTLRTCTPSRECRTQRCTYGLCTILSPTHLPKTGPSTEEHNISKQNALYGTAHDVLPQRACVWIWFILINRTLFATLLSTLHSLMQCKANI
jgi:hypothetical protein